MPVIESRFSGNRFTKNSHAETILPGLFRNVEIPYHRQRLLLSDGDFIDLDWIRAGQSKLLVLLHGLEGSSESAYIKGFAKLFSSTGFDVCAVNFRSCSGEPNLMLRSYHSGATGDIHEIIQSIFPSITHDKAGELNSKYENLYFAGFSLGGNVLLKYLGEGLYPIPKQLSSAVAFSVPIDLLAGARRLASWDNKPYMYLFLKSMNRKLMDKKKRFPGEIDISGLQRIRTFEDWDNRFTAPIHGFKDSSDYYSQCSSKQYLKHIPVPVLLVNAINDPFLPHECFPDQSELGPNVWFQSPDFGGHCGFSYSWPNGNYFSEEQAMQFFLNHK